MFPLWQFATIAAVVHSEPERRVRLIAQGRLCRPEPPQRDRRSAVASDGGRGRVPSSRLMSCVGGWSEDPRRRQRAQTSEWCGGRAPDARQGRDPNIAGNITTPTIRYRRQSGRTECGGNCSVRGLPQPARVVDDGVVRGAGGSVAGGGEKMPPPFVDGGEAAGTETATGSATGTGRRPRHYGSGPPRLAVRKVRRWQISRRSRTWRSPSETCP